ncbi:MAG: hypothetical protein GY805_22295 [Chloroflexi bacterium]|nr:hypothetical protein [Chloroflexota bacterium]
MPKSQAKRASVEQEFGSAISGVVVQSRLVGTNDRNCDPDGGGPSRDVAALRAR